MQEFYDITVAGVKRSLPVVPINENMSIAGFVIFGDTDVVEPCPCPGGKAAPRDRGVGDC